MKKLILALFVVFSVNSSFANDECIQNLCIGDEVMDNFGWSGYIASVDVSNNIVNVQMPIDGSIHPFPFKDLGERVECFRGLCEKEQVLYRDIESVEVVSIYNNSMVRVWSAVEDLMYIAKLSDLSK